MTFFGGFERLVFLSQSKEYLVVKVIRVKICFKCCSIFYDVFAIWVIFNSILWLVRDGSWCRYDKGILLFFGLVVVCLKSIDGM